MLLIIDNYDSFTYNLYQMLAERLERVEVVRNDRLTVDEAVAMQPDAVVVSPGPGRPESAGVSVDLIRRLAGQVPLLGVCLGHQAIGLAYGGRVARGPEPVHGMSAPVFHRGSGLFAGLENPFEAGRYHSLVVEREGLPDELEVEAETADGLLMAVRHRRHPVFGVQFHPESILTPGGGRLMDNFLRLAGLEKAHVARVH